MSIYQNGIEYITSNNISKIYWECLRRMSKWKWNKGYLWIGYNIHKWEYGVN